MVYFYIVEQLENNVVTTLEHNAAVRRQQQAQADNAAQSAAFWALRGGGKAEAAAQMKNPITLYGPQPVNSNNKSTNSTPVSNSIVTNANYNYATQMNDYQNANPVSDVNMGQGPQPYVNTNQSTAPKSNEVATDNLGGDIQHQETDLTTNVESTPPLEQGYHRMADGSIMANSDMLTHVTGTVDHVSGNSNGIMSRLGVFGLGLLAVGGIALVGMNRD